MRNTLATILLTMLPLSGMADWQMVKITTQKAEGTPLTLLVNSSKSGVKVNWGDGVSTPYTEIKDGVIEVSGTVKGEEITLGSERDITLLAADNCGITSIDVSGAPKLQSLYLQNNELTSINIGSLAELRDLNIANNHITTISLTSARFPNIETLDLSNNDFTTTTYNYGTENLQHLALASNSYKSVSLSKSPNLRSLSVKDNALTSLDLSKQQAISMLVAANNALEKLTLPDSAYALQQIDISNNAIETPLNLYYSRKLNALNVAHNQLYSLTLSTTARYQTFDCSDNALPISALPRKAGIPTVEANYLPQRDYDVCHLKGMAEGIWLTHYLPYAIMSPGYDNRKDEAYIVDMSELRSASALNSVVFTFYEVKEDGTETPLTLAGASNKTGDYTLNSGQVTFQRTLEKAYMTMTDPDYPGLTFRTIPFAVIDPTAEGIDQTTATDAQSAAIYNLQGMQVQQPQKGLYIIRGQKKLIK